jgi:hypothetical protein
MICKFIFLFKFEDRSYIGLEVRPRQSTTRSSSSLFFFLGNWNGEKTIDLEQDSDAGYAARMSNFLDELEYLQSGSVHCTEDELVRTRKSHKPPCKIEGTSLGHCSYFPYGYSKDSGMKPCFSLELKTLDFVPEPYEADDDDGFEYLYLPFEIREMVLDQKEPRRIYVDCHGEHPVDEEVILGSVTYYPVHQGIPMGFFPRKTGDLGPLLAVQFSDLPKGQAVHVVCSLYFKGSENFEETKFQIIVEH